MKPIFLDTGYIIALEAVDDQYHDIALRHWHSLTKSLPSLITTSYILDEAVAFFSSRNRHAKAIEIGNYLLSSPSVHFIHVDEPLFYEAWQYFKQHTDKAYSLTDCVSFIVMRRFKIKAALTFDKHFVQMGFDKLP
ncbi:MAG: PIN domain-containing protein [Nitrospirota bacterium]